MASSRPPKPQAFTLIELLVVMAVIVIMTKVVSVLLPSMLSSHNLSTTIDTVADYLNYARVVATRQNTYVVVGFYPAKLLDGGDDLQMVGFRSLNGNYDASLSVTNPAAYVVLGKTTHLLNARLVAYSDYTSGLKTTVGNANLVPPQASVYDCATVVTAPATGSSVMPLMVGTAGPFSQCAIIFSPQGQALVVGTTIPTPAQMAQLPYYKNILVGLHGTRGGQFANSSTEQNSGVVVIDGGSGKNTSYRP